MKFLVIFAIFVAVASAQFPNVRRPLPPPSQPPRPAAPVSRSSNDQTANIIRYDNDINPDGSYSYAFETDNGIAAQEQGTPRDFGGNPPIIPDVAQGSFSWVSPEGEQVSISYVADENGYQPQGNAIPTPPPVPPQIARALEYIERNAPRK
ncbi:larval cuticle protein LCP-22-like [Galleria mellonella]|uniref:Larval cuticle protein LCP-22-like n=1 Tax=Galleria mellonella TaxID=7137 RepID=A0A6J1WC76_GALME|nr:larval cuticle protein LCP-22-like [Galleria mellonella]